MTSLSKLPNPEPADRQEVVRVSHEANGIERQESVQVSEQLDLGSGRVAGGAAVEHREQTVRDVAGERRLKLAKTTQVIWLLVGFVEGAVALRLFLKIIAANPDNAFAQLVYGFTGLFVGPFVGLTGTPTSGGSVLEISSVIAMVVYALLAWVAVRVARLILEQANTRTSATYDRSQS